MTMMHSLARLAPDPQTLRALVATGPSVTAAGRLLPEMRVRRLLVERVHFPGAKPVQIQIRALGAAGESRVLVGEWIGAQAAENALAEAARLAKPRRGQAAAAGGTTVVADPASGLVLRRPGFDARLPGLRLLHDPDWAAERLASLGLDPASTMALVAHRLGKRAVLRITGPDSTRYARLRPVTSSSGQAAYDRHLSLWSAVQGVADLAIPRPLGFDAALGLALFTELSGAPPIFQGLHGFRASDAVTRAIAALQAMPIDAPPHGPMDELAILDGWAERIAAVFPDLITALQPPLRWLRREMEALATAPPVPCHRDLHEGQILLDQGHAGFLDFDTLRLGDPAMDVGNLQAHLLLASLRDGLPRRAFVTAMNTALPHLPLPRIALWRRASLLRLAMIYAFSATPRAVIRGLIGEAD